MSHIDPFSDSAYSEVQGELEVIPHLSTPCDAPLDVDSVEVIPSDHRLLPSPAQTASESISESAIPTP